MTWPHVALLATVLAFVSWLQWLYFHKAELRRSADDNQAALKAVANLHRRLQTTEDEVVKLKSFPKR